MSFNISTSNGHGCGGPNVSTLLPWAELWDGGGDLIIQSEGSGLRQECGSHFGDIQALQNIPHRIPPIPEPRGPQDIQSVDPPLGHGEFCHDIRDGVLFHINSVIVIIIVHGVSKFLLISCDFSRFLLMSHNELLCEFLRQQVHYVRSGFGRFLLKCILGWNRSGIKESKGDFPPGFVVFLKILDDAGLSCKFIEYNWHGILA